MVRDVDLIPWAVQPRHRANAHLDNLRIEARVRAGEDPNDLSYEKRTNWLAFRRRRGVAGVGTDLAYHP